MQRVFQNLRVTHDHSEQVIEIMGDPASQHTQSLQPLCPVELFFHCDAVCYIGHATDHPDDGAVVIANQMTAILHLCPMTICTSETIAGGPMIVAILGNGQSASGQHLLPIIGVNQRSPGGVVRL